MEAAHVIMISCVRTSLGYGVLIHIYCAPFRVVLRPLAPDDEAPARKNVLHIMVLRKLLLRVLSLQCLASICSAVVGPL